MNIDISEVVNAKLQSLEESGAIQKAVEDTFEKAIMKAVTEALDGYSIRSALEKKVSEQVSSAIAEMDFSTYNAIMVEKMRQLVNNYCNEDIATKATAMLEKLFVYKREEIKLSEIFDAYRNYVLESVEESDKYEYRQFVMECEEDGNYGWLTCKLNEKEIDRWDQAVIQFSVHRDYKDKSVGTIGTLYLNGNSVKDGVVLGRLNGIEALVIQLLYNKTRIVIDVESTDELETYYDIDD